MTAELANNTANRDEESAGIASSISPSGDLLELQTVVPDALRCERLSASLEIVNEYSTPAVQSLVSEARSGTPPSTPQPLAPPPNNTTLSADYSEPMVLTADDEQSTNAAHGQQLFLQQPFQTSNDMTPAAQSITPRTIVSAPPDQLATNRVSECEAPATSETSDEDIYKYFIERALTNKARCRACKQRIEFNEWRFGVSISRRLNNPEPFKSWHHIRCIHTSFSAPQRFAKFVANPDTDIRDWQYLDHDVQRQFIEELIKLKDLVEENMQKIKTKKALKRSAKDASGSAANSAKRRKASPGRRGTSRRVVGDGNCGGSPYPEDCGDTTTDKQTLPKPLLIVMSEELFRRCVQRFYSIPSTNDDSLQTFDAVRRLLCEIRDVKDRTNALRLWFSHGRDGNGFHGDLRLWFHVLVSDSTNRSFGIKNKQLTKFFSTKILHIPLGVIEKNVRDIYLSKRKPPRQTPSHLADATNLASSPDEPPIWLSRSSERRTSNKHLPKLLVDMIRDGKRCKFQPKASSTLTLQQTWLNLQNISKLNREAARNQLLHSLLNDCHMDDVEPMLRLLLSENGTRLSLRQVLNAFQPGLYSTWYKEANSPKLNIYSERHFNTFMNAIDFDLIKSYKFDHFFPRLNGAQLNTTFEDLYSKTVSHRRNGRARRRTTTNSCRDSPCDTEDDDAAGGDDDDDDNDDVPIESGGEHRGGDCENDRATNISAKIASTAHSDVSLRENYEQECVGESDERAKSGDKDVRADPPNDATSYAPSDSFRVQSDSKSDSNPPPPPISFSKCVKILDRCRRLDC